MPVDEVPQVGPQTEAKETFIDAFFSFDAGLRSRVRAAGDAYANKRAHLNSNVDRDQAKYANRVLVGAEFVPAHPTRFNVRGPGRGPKFKYFVVHRPGAIRWKERNATTGRRRFASYSAARLYAEKACRLDNIIKEFRHLNAKTPAATHWIIGLDGKLVQMVDLDDVAYHTLNRKHPRTGESITNYNSFGVELEGYVQDSDPRGTSPFPAAQLRALGILLKMLHDNPDFPYNISEDLTVMHSEIDPRRKIDPGPNFNVQRDAIAWARKAGTFTSFYQPPISLDVVERIAAAKIGAIAGASTSGQVREERTTVAARMSARARASSMSRLDRSTFYASARSNALAHEAALGELAASVSKAETILNFPAAPAQENRTGLTLSWEDGTWNDGS